MSAARDGRQCAALLFAVVAVVSARPGPPPVTGCAERPESSLVRGRYTTLADATPRWARWRPSRVLQQGVRDGRTRARFQCDWSFLDGRLVGSPVAKHNLCRAYLLISGKPGWKTVNGAQDKVQPHLPSPTQVASNEDNKTNVRQRNEQLLVSKRACPSAGSGSGSGPDAAPNDSDRPLAGAPAIYIHSSTRTAYSASGSDVKVRPEGVTWGAEQSVVDGGKPRWVRWEPGGTFRPAPRSRLQQLHTCPLPIAPYTERAEAPGVGSHWSGRVVMVPRYVLVLCKSRRAAVSSVQGGAQPVPEAAPRTPGARDGDGCTLTR